MKKYKLVVYVPEDHADKLREAMGNAGAGEIGNYEHCKYLVQIFRKGLLAVSAMLVSGFPSGLWMEFARAMTQMPQFAETKQKIASAVVEFEDGKALSHLGCTWLLSRVR
jgi:hypothetical protein